MTTHYVPLEQGKLKQDAILAHPPTLPELVYLDDQASNIMIDLAHEDFLTIDVNHKFDDIQRLIYISHLSDLLVADNKHVVGVICSRDLHGIKPAKICQDKGIDRSEITATMLMTSREEMLIFEYDQITRARVGNIVASFNQHKKKYALVVECANSSSQQMLSGLGDIYPRGQMIRGLIIAAKLNAQLGEQNNIINY